MLKREPIPEVTTDAFDAIVARKHLLMRARLTRIRASVAQSYAAYPDLGTLAPAGWSGADEVALVHCYGSGTKPLYALKARLISRQSAHLRTLCPYCGMVGARTFDHYAPQALFPEFAVCHLNLIRVCHECNQLKDDTWDSLNRPVLHSYLDAVPSDTRWLSARVDMNGDPKIDFSLELPPELDADFAALLTKHFGTLQLVRRYRESSHELIIEACCWSDQADVASVEASLKKTAREHALRFGLNHWKAVAFEAMAASPPLLAWVLQQVPTA